MTIEREELEAIFQQLEARVRAGQEEAVRKAVETFQVQVQAQPVHVENHAHVRRRKRMATVVVVIVVMVAFDHVVEIAAVMKGTELFIAAFFSWLFDESRVGGIALPSVPLHKLKVRRVRGSPQEQQEETVLEE